MMGKILGFNQTEGSGAIAAEDGSRHRFLTEDWRGDKPPVAGMTVDFDSDGGTAKDIYPVSGVALDSFKVDLSGITASAEGTRVVALFTRSLSTPLALGVLLACFMTALSSPVQSATLLGLGQIVDQLSMASAAGGMMGADTSGMGTMQALLFLRFAAPIAALWLMSAAWRGKSEKLPLLATGAAAILAALLVVGLRSAILSMAPDFLREQLAAGISLGFGVWLLFLLGGALMAAGFGKLRNPLAKGE
ncbi:MAG: hypothetical protein H6916_13205 [Novosphingobium sp.]|uniref:hypothetical protein n=1 Tax=Novosphingobium sp. TaxID=1874826 RepID=UPI001D4C64A7|nr:hypothetical protein [Novosphingobium sp.]MCB2057422.1 hypothetical protein [Novosphingobium sp.]MCP5387752.1 hypothetical protein [Novosphingobium sp.]